MKPMFVNNVYRIQNFPVEQKQRQWTDCWCTILAAVFSLTMFLIACFSWNQNNYLQVNYPTQTSNGQLCYWDLRNDPYVYFQQVNNSAVQRFCVSSCPVAGQLLSCSNSTNCAGVVSTYSTAGVINGLGGVCEPTNAALKSTFYADSQINSKLASIQMWNITLIGLIISTLVGLIYMVVVIIVPKVMGHLVFVLSAVVLLVAGILLLVQPIRLEAFYNNVWNIIIAVIMIVVAVALVIFLFCQRQQLQIGSIFLLYGSNFLKEKFSLFFYVPLFMVVSFLTVVLFIWQFVAIGSANTPTWQSSQVYKHIYFNAFLQTLNVIEFIWAIQFVRDSFNYLISGYAVEWYFTSNTQGTTTCGAPWNRYFCRNFGSIVAGSFLNAFFSLLSIIIDFFRCDPKGCCGRATKCCHQIFCCCCSVFDMVRADAYAYIHLSGIPYCNSARQCQAICEETHLFTSDRTCLHLYRLAAQIFVVTLSVLISLIIFNAKTNFITMVALAVVVLYSYLMATHFVDIHTNAAEGLVTCYLVQENCEEPQNVKVCPANLRLMVLDFEKQFGLLPQDAVGYS